MRLIDADEVIARIDAKLNEASTRTESEYGIIGYKNACVAIKRMLDSLPTVNRWIPVSERLPENALDVLISDNIGHVEIGCCINGKWYDYNVDEYGEQDENFDLEVVAWMPLPKPYKEDNE